MTRELNQWIVVVVGVGCVIATYIWGRSSARLLRAARRAEEGVRNGVLSRESALLARSAFRKELHTTVLYAFIAFRAIVTALPDHPVLDLPFLLVLVPVAVTLYYGQRFLAEARLAEERSRLERRAEEVLEQMELAPQRWSARLAPAELPSLDGFEASALYEPGTGAMAGDFYDVVPLHPTRVAVVIGDVSGHGIEPSITAFQVKYLLRVLLKKYRDPAQALEELNDALYGQIRVEEFASVCAVVLDTAAGTIRYASAGHPPAWLWHDGEVRALRATGPLVGIDGASTYVSREVALQAGDVVLMYTDGLAEARSGDELFGEERIAGILRRDPGRDTTSMCKGVVEAARDFADAPLSDDVAIVAVRRT